MQPKDKIETGCLTFLIITCIFIVVFWGMGVVVMLLWNWLMPFIFGLVTINIWQAIGLILLSSFLLKSKFSVNNAKSIWSFKNRFNP